MRRRGQKEGPVPSVLFLRTALPSFHHHGRMDHSGEAAGGSGPAALHHDWQVRQELLCCIKVLLYPHLECGVPVL